MTRKALSGIVLTLLLIGMLTLAFNIQQVTAAGNIYIRADGTVEGTTNIVSNDNVTYVLNADIEDFNSIVVERSNIVFNGKGHSLKPTYNYGEAAIFLSSVNNVTITETNMPSLYFYGIHVYGCSKITISENNITSFSDYGVPIYLQGSSNSSIFGNDINADGYYMYGIDFLSSSNNSIYGNNITARWGYGVLLSYSSGNSVFENSIVGSMYGIFLSGSSSNKFYHNNFINNGAGQVHCEGSEINVWDDGYPSGGNYWSDYIGGDIYSGPYQNETGSDGIGDEPYIINEWNRDNYPIPYILADTAPPNIQSMSTNPTIPNYDEEALVSSTIIDVYGQVDHAILSYTQNLAWHNVSMNGLGNLFSATIPAQPYGTAVQYKIYANDTNDNWAESELYSYMVGDFVAPQVSLSKFPDYPLSAQNVKVYAEVTEPVDASGVEIVLFSYRVNSGEWWNTAMTFNETLGLYESTIPDQEVRDLVEYFVKAIDIAGNLNATEVHSYLVGLAGDADHDGDVDYDDFIVLAGAYGSYSGQPAYKIQADFDLDNNIDYDDFILLAGNYGRTIL